MLSPTCLKERISMVTNGTSLLIPPSSRQTRCHPHMLSTTCIRERIPMVTNGTSLLTPPSSPQTRYHPRMLSTTCIRERISMVTYGTSLSAAAGHPGMVGLPLAPSFQPPLHKSTTEDGPSAGTSNYWNLLPHYPEPFPPFNSTPC